MSPKSVSEYLAAIRPRYQRAPKGEKGKLLDEAVQVTGYHRKALVRLLRGPAAPVPHARRGRPRRYGVDLVAPLVSLWEATGRVCPQRLRPFLPALIDQMQRHQEVHLPAETRRQVLAMSASTIDRLLRPVRHKEGRRPWSTTKPGTLLKQAIPIRTFAQWDDHRPGFLEADLVAHCGESTEGFSLNTLTAVDIATGWVERQAVWGKSQDRVGAALHELGQRLPFPWLGLDSDNGGEFINRDLLAYCQRHQLTFTRSRPYKKNDNAHVEGKNWTAVRRLVGYDRYTSRAALETLNRLYGLLRWHTNFFQPVMQLQSKTREGARVRKTYDEAKTPYQRVLDSGVLTDQQRAELVALYAGLKPAWLMQQIASAQQHLWRLAERAPQRTPAPSGDAGIPGASATRRLTAQGTAGEQGGGLPTAT